MRGHASHAVPDTAWTCLKSNGKRHGCGPGSGGVVQIGQFIDTRGIMNATVTRSAGKSTNTKGTAKVAAKTAKAKPAAKPTKAVGSALKSAAKTATATPKAIAKPPQTTVKSQVKPAARTTVKSTVKAAPVKAATTASARAGSTKTAVEKGSKPVTALKQAASIPASKPSSKETSVSAASSVKGSAGLTDKMQNSVVSKVSEVATKTSKSTVPADGTLLTEEQILKMNEKDYMNAAQLAFFKARLQQLERDLLKNAGETTEHLRETVLVPDPADRATIEEEHALELRTRDRERKLLKKVQQSIASIDAGEYGWCEETGEPIGIPRLLARPTATLSLEAQQRRELKQKLYGD
jgi:DnaK suppressor protein